MDGISHNEQLASCVNLKSGRRQGRMAPYSIISSPFTAYDEVSLKQKLMLHIFSLFIPSFFLQKSINSLTQSDAKVPPCPANL